MKIKLSPSSAGIPEIVYHFFLIPFVISLFAVIGICYIIYWFMIQLMLGLSLIVLSIYDIFKSRG